MSLAVFIGVFAAQIAFAIVLGTALLFVAARCWRAPAMSWRRALALCLALDATSVCGAMMLAVISGFAFRRRADVIGVVLVFSVGLAIPAIQWYWVKRLSRTGVARSLAIWVSARVPLAIGTLAIACVCRAYLFEAFVVPTGSMAPNLIGAHADRVCSNCGRPFAVSLSLWEPRSDIPRRPLATTCVNCRERDTVEIDTVLHRGDRMIVDKRGTPRRWSVIVFRVPPERTQNYVKRLVGLPGETVEIAGGEVFINGELLRKDPRTTTDLWLPVHDTQFQPKLRGSRTPYWQHQVNRGDVPDANGGLRLTAGKGQRDALEFVGEITDLLDYNDDMNFSTATHENFVGDVLLNCAVSELTGSGTIGVDWNFRDDSLTIKIGLQGNVSIQARSARGGERQQVAASARLGRPIAAGDLLGFAVRDAQAYLLVNDDLVALTPIGPDDVDAFRSSDALADQPCELAIWADDCSMALQYITLMRDVYYIGHPSETDASLGPLRGGTHSPVELGTTEYFVLADNSARGFDSRFYSDLQASDIIGVVRWIYWPVRRWREL